MVTVLIGAGFYGWGGHPFPVIKNKKECLARSYVIDCPREGLGTGHPGSELISEALISSGGGQRVWA